MKIKRWLKFLLIGFVLFLAISFFVVPPVLKNYLLSRSKEWVGRSMALEGVKFNVFNGSITLTGLKLYEKDDTSVFVSLESLYINSALIKCASGNYELTEILLDKPFISIIQQGDSFNYTGLEKRFSTTDTTAVDASAEEPVKYWLRNMSILEGVVSYRNLDVNSDIRMENIHVKSPLFAWDDPQLHYDFGLQLNHGGKAAGSFDMNIESLAYKTNYKLDSLNMDILLPLSKGLYEGG